MNKNFNIVVDLHVYVDMYVDSKETNGKCLEGGEKLKRSKTTSKK